MTAQTKSDVLHLCLLFFHFCKAFAAIDGTVRLGLKRNAGLAAAGSAGGSEELSGATSSILSGVTASLAALGLILEASFSIKLLLTGGKHEFLTAFFAN